MARCAWIAAIFLACSSEAPPFRAKDACWWSTARQAVTCLSPLENGVRRGTFSSDRRTCTFSDRSTVRFNRVFPTGRIRYDIRMEFQNPTGQFCNRIFYTESERPPPDYRFYIEITASDGTRVTTQQDPNGYVAICGQYRYSAPERVLVCNGMDESHTTLGLSCSNENDVLRCWLGGVDERIHLFECAP
jgi:hypothetical protein